LLQLFIEAVAQSRLGLKTKLHLTINVVHIIIHHTLHYTSV